MNKLNSIKYCLLAIVCAVFAACSTTADEIEEQGGGSKPGENDPITEEQAANIDLTWDERQIARGQYDMAFSMLASSLTENGNQDVLLSPLSAELAIDMLANGMQGEDLDTLLKALGANDLATLNSLNKKVVEKLPMYNPSGVKVKMDFGNWQNTLYTFNPEYAASIKDLLDVPTYSYDFSKTDMRSIINKWAYDKTEGLIKDLLKSPVLPNTPMVLCNSLYFDSKWKNPFEKSKTVQANFKDVNGTVTGKAMMMTYPKKVTYSQGKKYKRASLAYQGDKFYFNVYLPEPRCTFDDVITEIKNPTANEVYYAKSLKIPRFEMDYNGDITASLKAYGVNFEKADFSRICDKIRAIGMLQGTYMKVNEEGTLAAAVTATYALTSSGQEIKVGEDFIADRPFIFTVSERNGLVLFVGTMSNPDVK